MGRRTEAADRSIKDIINQAYAQQLLPEHKRIPHFLLIDETLNVEHGCLVDPVSETRKYKLGIVASSQFTKQLDPDLRDALLSNVGSIFAYRCSKDDAELFASIMDEFHPRRFVDLKRGEAFVRLLKDGSPIAPFRAEIELADIPQHNAGEIIRAASQQQYGMSTKDIQTNFTHWVTKQMVNHEERKERHQAITKKQRQTTIAKLDRHLPTPSGKPLSPTQRTQRIKTIADMLDKRGRNDQAWPTDLKLHKANRRRKRSSPHKSDAANPSHF